MTNDHMHERLTQIFAQLGVDYEIIFVNDCSPANDEGVIRQLCDKDSHVIGISHSRNFWLTKCLSERDGDRDR